MNREWARRAFYVLLLFAIVFGVEGARLAWLQLGLGGGRAAGGAIARKAVLQRSDELLLDSGRGQFRDRSGKLLTGETVQSLAAFPDNGMARGPDAVLQLLADAIGAEPGRLAGWLDGLREPQVWMGADGERALDLSDEQIGAVNRANLMGVTVLPYRNRYSADHAPIHAIGYISQHPERVRQIYGAQIVTGQMSATSRIGGAGLEKSLDRLLQGIGSTAAVQVTDGRRRPLEGLGLRMTAPDNPHFPLQVTTTLDLDVQRAIEDVLQNRGIAKGAVVVLDAANADVLGMVSLPRLDPYRIGTNGTDERNHALTASPPGSVFKTVTLAAAIESGVADWDDKFRCDGHYHRYGLKCWKAGGHGVLTLKEAYAESCNVVFAELAERMDPAWLQITGERLGFGRQIGWHTDKFTDGKPLRLLEEEESGAIFLSRKLAEDGGVRTGTGIGQRDVRITPLQAANMAVTIVNGGRVLSPRLVKEIRYADGGLMTPFPRQTAKSRYGQIEANTAALLREGMRSVVVEGTAENALKHAAWPLAGKSGTAELAGKQKARNDHWFVGYGPAQGKPRYAAAIFIEDQPAGLTNRAAGLFGDIMERLRDLERRRQPAGAQAVER